MRCRSIFLVASVKFDFYYRRSGQFAIECRPIRDAAAQKLRPWRNRDIRGDRLRQQPPKLGMMPAQIMTGAVPMRPNACPEPFHFRDQRLAIHTENVFVHLFTFLAQYARKR